MTLHLMPRFSEPRRESPEEIARWEWHDAILRHQGVAQALVEVLCKLPLDRQTPHIEAAISDLMSAADSLGRAAGEVEEGE